MFINTEESIRENTPSLTSTRLETKHIERLLTMENLSDVVTAWQRKRECKQRNQGKPFKKDVGFTRLRSFSFAKDIKNELKRKIHKKLEK